MPLLVDHSFFLSSSFFPCFFQERVVLLLLRMFIVSLLLPFSLRNNRLPIFIHAIDGWFVFCCCKFLTLFRIVVISSSCNFCFRSAFPSISRGSRRLKQRNPKNDGFPFAFLPLGPCHPPTHASASVAAAVMFSFVFCC